MLYVAYIIEIAYSSGPQKRNHDLDAGAAIKSGNETEMEQGRKVNVAHAEGITGSYLATVEPNML